VGPQLVGPLADIFRDPSRRQIERSLAAEILCDFASDQPHLLTDLILDADEKQFGELFAKLKNQKEAALQVLNAELAKPVPDKACPDAKEKLAKRQANAAVLLLRLDKGEEAWPLLKGGPDPLRRSYLLHRLGPFGVDPSVVLKRLEVEEDLSTRRALLLSLGEFAKKDFEKGERDRFVKKMCAIYREATDPGLHAAAEWCLREWKEDLWLKRMEKEWEKDNRFREQKLNQIRQELAQEKAQAGRQWYVNSQGQTMVVLPGPVTFTMGSPDTEAGREPEEMLHERRIGRSFAIASKPVTVEQFLRWCPSYDYRTQYSPELNCPITRVTWYAAAEYCNWLSLKEGLPEKEWCYLRNKTGKYADEMRLAPDYLKRTGYRLPTEAEWEFACRAGAKTSRYYGDSEELLPKYAWFMSNSRHRSGLVGSLKPNDLGLFDMHGNVFIWCQETLRDYVILPGGAAQDDTEDDPEVREKDFRVVRGGSFADTPWDLRCAYRIGTHPSLRNNYMGLRPVRTFR
jgi:formylglycine-generating enzyme required for sulfatase activity